jgi:hypothetical protein
MNSRRLISLSSLIFATLFVILALLVLFRSQPLRLPERPETVPSTSHWLGGVDGGVWITCCAKGKRQVFCEFFADVTGVRVDSAVFIAPSNFPDLVVNKSFYDSLSYFDGERIRTITGEFYVKNSTLKKA